MVGVSMHLRLFLFPLIITMSLLAMTIHAREIGANNFVRSAPEPLHAQLPWLSLPWLSLRYYSLEAGWVKGGPCKHSDYKCMNALSLKYVNEQRKKHNRKLYEYKMGTMKMLENALKHSKAMQSRKRCYHQRLDKVKLGCSAFFAAENVAQSHVLLNPGGPTDPAKMCSDQLRKSPPHYKNIVSDYNKQFVMGVFVDKQGYIWCTQLFTVFAQKGGGECKEAPGVRKASPSPNPSPSPKPYQMASTGHVFKKTVFEHDGRKLPLQCGYCLKEGGYCMPEAESIKFDKGMRPADKKIDFNASNGGGNDEDEDYWGDEDDWGGDEGFGDDEEIDFGGEEEEEGAGDDDESGFGEGEDEEWQ